MTEADEIREHRARLEKSLNEIKKELAAFREMRDADRIEYSDRNKRYRSGAVAMALVMVLTAVIGIQGLRTANRVSDYIACQDRKDAIRAQAAQDATASTLSMSVILTDPHASEADKQAARVDRLNKLKAQARAQLENPTGACGTL